MSIFLSQKKHVKLLILLEPLFYVGKNKGKLRLIKQVAGTEGI
ncbi:hypothetical protein FB550_10710 [Neobacillus bataviensis]|uniref:Uncharacterized protein n=1 Tax=Neobacillus bataviensis TaxID=220685 RepID=A0A561D7E8_9BACI|nr:hypothetical protein FB550_10710 [Neobacillus bataviensis]